MEARCEGVNHGHPAITGASTAGFAGEANGRPAAAADAEGRSHEDSQHGLSRLSG